ncbi:hypothetical protein MPER_14415, partial [Moniliophthora perniciosa FA553]
YPNSIDPATHFYIDTVYLYIHSTSHYPYYPEHSYHRESAPECGKVGSIAGGIFGAVVGLVARRYRKRLLE